MKATCNPASDKAKLQDQSADQVLTNGVHHSEEDEKAAELVELKQLKCGPELCEVDLKDEDAKDRGAVERLGEQLTVARQELRLRDEEVARLSRIRTEVEAELEELTASLFQVIAELRLTYNF
ncbi:hypothetical protein B566_EDAN017707 [Ephemera danica]|nr:hypothetical protein B566_EDAN017707 [Ephemera danica]